LQFVLGQVDFVDRLAVQLDRELVPLDGDVEVVPVAGRLGGVLGRRNAGNDAAAVVVGQLGVGRLAAGVVDLHFDTGGDRFFDVAHVKVEAAVAPLLYLVVEGDFKVLVFPFEPEVGIVSLPAFFAGARREGNHAIFQLPVAGGGPVFIEFAVEQFDPFPFGSEGGGGKAEDECNGKR